MPERSGKVSHKIERMTESLAKNIISQAVTTVRSRKNLKPVDLADEIGCEKSTIENAESGAHMMRANNLFNLLTVDPFALEGLLHHYGRRSVPIEAKCDVDALIPTTAAVHKLALAQADGSMSDRECLDMEPEIEAAIDALASVKARCEDIRARRVA
jgi:transcriptional regulator with XRE-family HTH domain